MKVAAAVVAATFAATGVALAKGDPWSPAQKRRLVTLISSRLAFAELLRIAAGLKQVR